MIPFERIVIEGPDCSGKTSLVESLKHALQYRYNVQDRSNLSMYAYDILYDRNTLQQNKENWQIEINNQNNLVILVLPSIGELHARFEKRGDEKQDRQSLTKLHEIFKNIYNHYGKRRNFICVSRGKSDTDEIIKIISCLENQTHENFPLVECIRHSMKYEACNISFNFTDKEINDNASRLLKTLAHPLEGEYYVSIFDKLLEKIRFERAGWNKYDSEQDDFSRRFVFSDEDCISFLHVRKIDNQLYFDAICRSTNAVKNSCDIEFICNFACYVNDVFTVPANKIIVNVRMNCLHVTP